MDCAEPAEALLNEQIRFSLRHRDDPCRVEPERRRLRLVAKSSGRTVGLAGISECRTTVGRAAFRSTVPCITHAHRFTQVATPLQANQRTSNASISVAIVTV
jgi:hypothetical protein